MPLMPDSYVTSAKIVNGKIQLKVQVDQFAAQAHQFDDGQYVEISGQATQTSGAFANFYDIQPVPAKPEVPANPNDTEHYCIYVTGAPIPHQFKNEDDVTIVIRAARVWLTVLGPNTNLNLPRGSNGVTWDKDPKVVSLAGGSW
jgi:hypothetical protein